MPAEWGSLPFAEQIAFFRQKLNIPTARWDDLWQEAHDTGFMVAGAAKADLLQDLCEALDKAISQGTTLAEFRQDFEQIVANRGWTGWTGSETAAGRAWRTRVIYATNLRTSYAAGRYQQLQAIKHRRPYWRYVHNETVVNPRPEHLAWDGLILPADDPWWQSHYPPNGWGCRCRIESLAQRDLDRMGKSGPDQAPTDPDDTTGIDPGWAYAPGANAATPLRELIDRKLFNLDAPIGAAMWGAMAETLAMQTRLAVADMTDRVSREMRAKGESLLVHGVAPATLADLSARQVELQSAGIWLRDEELLHALRAAKDARGRALPIEVWRELPRWLETAVPYLDRVDQALLYAFELPPDKGKVVIRINYNDKVRVGGQRARVTANFVRTGGIVAESDIRNDSRYVELSK